MQTKAVAVGDTIAESWRSNHGLVNFGTVDRIGRRWIRVRVRGTVVLLDKRTLKHKADPTAGDVCYARAEPPPVHRSGTTWTEAHYAAKGYGTVKLRLPLDALELLQKRAEQDGCSRAEVVDAALRAYVAR